MFEDEIIAKWLEMVDMVSLVKFGQGEEMIAMMLFSLVMMK